MNTVFNSQYGSASVNGVLYHLMPKGWYRWAKGSDGCPVFRLATELELEELELEELELEKEKKQ